MRKFAAGGIAMDAQHFIEANRNVQISRLVNEAVTEIEKNHIDAHGLIVQRNGDGGDTFNRTPIVHCLLVWLGLIEAFRQKSVFLSYIQAMDKLEVERGKFVRHPYPPQDKCWMADWRTTSRDQLSTLAWAAHDFRDQRRLKRHAWYLLKHFGFYPNIYPIGVKYFRMKKKIPDMVGPTQIADIFRGLDWWFMYPLIFVLDFGLLVNALLRIGKNEFNDTGSNDVNMFMHIIFSERAYPTLFSKLAKWVYFKTDPMSRLKFYFRFSNYGPPIWKLYAAIALIYVKGFTIND